MTVSDRRSPTDRAGMNALKYLIALAESAEGAAVGFTPRHAAVLKNIRIDLALAAKVGAGIDAYRDLLLAATDVPLTAPKRVRARLVALRDMPNDASLRTAVLALAAEIKRADVLSPAWKAVLNDYTMLMDLGTGAYQPVDDDAVARRAVLTTMLAVDDDFPRKLTGLLEIAEYDDLAWSPEISQNLRDDCSYVQALRAGQAASAAV